MEERKEEMQELANELSNIFIQSLEMLNDEIEENNEEYNTFKDVDELVKQWNKIINKYL